MTIPTKIIYVLPGGAQGGGMTVVFQLIKSFYNDAAFSVGLITEPGSPAESMALDMGIKVFTVPMMHSRFSKKSVNQLREIFAEFKPDIIHSHGSRAGFYCARAGAGTYPYFIHAVHGYHFVTKPFIMRNIAIFFERFTHKHAHLVTNDGFNEHELAQRLKLLPAGKAHMVMPLGISPDIKIVTDGDRHKHKHVVFLGRLSEEKRPEFCLEVFKYLQAFGYKLTFVGGGDLQADIDKVIQENGWQDVVQCTGILPQKEAVAQLLDKSLLILPSKAEGLGLAVLEGYASGLPAVGAMVHGINEVIRNGETGYTIPTQDAQEYAKKIMYLHENPDVYYRFVKAGQAMLDIYSYNKFIERHRELYLNFRVGS